jgi:DNA-binding transcriptional regulator YiaG
MKYPDPADVVKLREEIQLRFGLGITAAQDHCAELLHTSRRAWQQWEAGDRKMHPGFWELANIKIESK